MCCTHGWKVGEGNSDGVMAMGQEMDDGDEDEEGQEAVEDMAKATFEGHADSVYCVAANPKNPSQVP